MDFIEWAKMVWRWASPKAKPILERAIKTFFQVFIVVTGIPAVADLTTSGLTWDQVDWGLGLNAASLAAVLSVLMSLASWKFGKNAGPSLTDEKIEQAKEITSV